MKHVKPIATTFLVFVIGISMICYYSIALDARGHWSEMNLLTLIGGAIASGLAVVFLFYYVVFVVLMKVGREAD
jgi:hypothetical protein